MWSLINTASDAVALHPGLAVLIAFLAAIIEAVAVLGILIPGTPILMAVAGAAAVAGVSMTPILLVSVLGAIIGDGISFWVGYRFGGRLREIWPLRGHPAMMHRADTFFRRHGALSVAICRFIPVLRSTVPLVAGMSGMAVSRFAVANVCSAMIWAPVHILPAQFAGRTLSRMEGGDWKGALLLGAITLGAIAFAVGVHYAFRRRPPATLLSPVIARSAATKQSSRAT